MGITAGRRRSDLSRCSSVPRILKFDESNFRFGILVFVTFDRTIGRTLKLWRVSGNLGEIALLTNKDVTNCLKGSRLIQGTGEDTRTRLVR